jgi:membrane protein insertase Oxa1/YidC/SpoIIIJ
MQMQRTMVLISPLMIFVFALNVPAGLGLYWFVGNCVSIIQQSFVVGWGNVLPKRMQPAAQGVVSGSAGRASVNGQKTRPPAIQSKSKAANKAQKR